MEKVNLNLIDVGGKARSKSELYKLLTVEGHLYLPPYKFCSVDFMADIIEGKRKALESKEVIIRHLPHVKGLRTEDLVDFLVNECDAEHFLPRKFKESALYRYWVGNICNSLSTSQFNDYVENKLYQRQQLIIKKNCLSVEALPKFAKLFENSLMVSTQRGKSNLMLNRSKRRIREEAEEERKNHEDELKSQIEELKREVHLLQKDLDVAQYDKLEADKNADMLHRLYLGNIIDEEGNIKQ